MMLEKLVKRMKSFPNVWFARMIDVAKNMEKLVILKRLIRISASIIFSNLKPQ
jgi:hypothetical protein